MGTAPTPPDWVELEEATEAKMDSISTAISFLRSPPRAQLGRTTSNQSIADTTHTAVQWNAEEFDSENGHDNSTNNSRYTAPYDGVYEVSAQIPFEDLPVSFKMELYFKRSDGTEFNGTAQTKTSSDVTVVLSSSTQVSMTTGQYVEAYVWHNRGSAVAIDRTFHGGPRFNIRWVSA